MKGITKRVEQPRKKTALLQREGKKTGRNCLLLLLQSFVLAGFRVAGQTIPLAACLITALPFGLGSLSAACGAMLGYVFRTGGVETVENLAMTVLLLAAVAVFQGTHLPGKVWFWPTMAAGVCAVLGAVTLFSAGEGPLSWAARCFGAAIGTVVLRNALGGVKSAQLILAAALVASLIGVGAPLDMGVFCAFAFCTALQDLLPCALMGLALDLCGGFNGAMTAALLLPGAICHLRQWSESLRSGGFLVFSTLLLALFGQLDAALLFSVALGVAVGAVVHHSRRKPFFITSEPADESAMRLEKAAEILDLLGQQLPTGEEEPVREAESVYDGAAEQLCRCCACYHRCWESRREETFFALHTAARTIIQRGVAQREDFPQSFRENCCHLDGFIMAVNQELEGMLFRRRYRMELLESRAVLAEEFSCVASFLRASAVQRVRRSPAYRPVVGSCSVGKGGSSVCGDRGVSFAGKHQDYYVLLCDGMGTGDEASKYSGETVFLLQKLLKSGVEAEAALKILNGLELLRAADRFTTVDLLHVDLTAATAVLYKWGSAPSYWRSDRSVKKIGTASPPPGVGVGGDYAPERYELSLKEGELVVLASDGATEAEQTIGDYCGDSAHELAALLVSDLSGEDDVSAVVVSLRPGAS